MVHSMRRVADQRTNKPRRLGGEKWVPVVGGLCVEVTVELIDLA